MEFTCRRRSDQWDKIYHYLCEYKGLNTGNECVTRRFVEGVFLMLKSAAQWRLLIKKYGNWNVVYQRFAEWCEKGIWYKMLYYFSVDPDMEYIMIDSTILRAHACATVKKDSRSSNARSITRRFFDQDSRCLRCTW